MKSILLSFRNVGVKAAKAALPDVLLDWLRGRRPWNRWTQDVSPYLPEIVCIDVGASYFPHMKWGVFLKSSRTSWVAVEPNKQNLSYLDNWRFPAKTIAVTTGLSQHGGAQTLYLTKVDSGSSLLEPHVPDSMKHRMTERQLSYYFPVQTVQIDTVTLMNVIDRVPNQAPIVIKLDTQGSELAILRGAETLLRSSRIVGIEMEVGMLAEPVMKGAAKLWEAGKYLEDLGFELIDIDPVRSPTNLGIRNPKAKRYLSECDAIYLLRQDVVRKLPPEYRAALFGCYLSYDLLEEAYSLLNSDAALRKLLEEGGANLRRLESKLLALA